MGKGISLKFIFILFQEYSVYLLRVRDEKQIG